MLSSRPTTAPFIAALLLLLLGAPAVAREVPAQLPDLAGKTANQTKPVQVYVLMGQSNMRGFGQVGPVETNGTLEHLTREEGKYPHHMGDDLLDTGLAD